MLKKTNKVILIGDGAVGSSFAFSLVNQNFVHELGIIDMDMEKVQGDVMDLQSALPFTGSMRLFAAEYADCRDADIIVLTAGAGQKPGETRLDLVDKNLKITKSICDQITASGFSGIILVASNPVDILTYAVQKFTGFPEERVIGSGTSLDTARFQQAIAAKLNVNPRNVHGYIMGEHGDSEFAVWSCTNIAGLDIADWLEQNPVDDEIELLEIFYEVKNQAYEIIKRKGATFYGIGAGLARIVKAILNNENSIIALSVKLNGQYGADDIYIGVPALINRSGIQSIIELPLSEVEQENMTKSVNILKDTIKEAHTNNPDLQLL